VDGIQIALAETHWFFRWKCGRTCCSVGVCRQQDQRMRACASADTLGSLIALTHTLAGSLKEWREAA